MKNEVIIVKGASELIGTISSVEVEELVFIMIDKTLFDKEKLIRVNGMEHIVNLEDGQLNILVTEDSDWYNFLYSTKTTGEHFNSMFLTWYWVEGRCGYHTVYIKKEGSDAKIDEE